MSIQVRKLALAVIGLLIWLQTAAVANAVMQAGDTSSIKISAVNRLSDMAARTRLFVDSAERSMFPRIPLSAFRFDSAYFSGTLPIDQVRHPHYLYFSVENDLDHTAALYWYAGIHQALDLREVNAQGRLIAELPAITYRLQYSYFFNKRVFRLSFAPRQRRDFVAKINPKLSGSADFQLYLVPEPAMEDVLHTDFGAIREDVLVLTDTVFIGMMLMMWLYTLLTFIQIRSTDYLYYTAYIFCFLAYIGLKIVASNMDSLQQNRFYYSYLNNGLQVWGYVMYYFFVRKFLSTRQTAPLLDKLLLGAAWTLAVYGIADLAAWFFPASYQARTLAWDAVRISLSVMTVFFIVLMFRMRSRLAVYLIAGGLCLTVLGLVAMFTSIDNSLVAAMPLPFNNPIFYFESGIVIELLFFSLGLGYKNRLEAREKARVTQTLKITQARRELDNFRAAIEAREAERRRIAAEMHDDIGSGLTSILFLGSALQRDSVNGHDATSDKIMSTASGLVDKMNEIIWSMNRDCDTLPHLVAYVRSHISELLETTGLTYGFNVKEPLPELVLNGEQRRNIYLVVKETVHNAIKHADATHITIHVACNGLLLITVRDNGKGMNELTSGKFGNGLKNMRQRMTAIGGSLKIETENGTTVQLEMPLQ